MFRLVILSVLILNTLAKFLEFDGQNGIESEYGASIIQVKYVNTGTPLWVVSLSGDDWLAPKLRLGNITELEEFFRFVGPIVKNSQLQSRLPRVKKDDPGRTTTNPAQKSNSEIKNDFIQMINKFALSTTLEPDAYISDNDHDSYNPAVLLFLKDSYASLMVELGRRRWHYFISESSSLPTWFFESHDPLESPLLIPEEVKTQLYSTLWFLLHVMFSYPV